LLIVATETAVDGATPVASFVQELLNVGPHCRVFELKHTSYAGTAAVMTAADWIRAGGPRDRRALVIAADITRAAIGSPGEPTQGAAAVAMLMEPQPRAVVLSEETGLHTASVHDEPIVDESSSRRAYLEALEQAFLAYRALERPPLEQDEGLSDRLARVLYHAPFPKLIEGAHRRLVELDWQHAPGRWPTVEHRLEDAASSSFAELAAPGLQVGTRVGNTSTASLYLALAALLEGEGRRLGGRRIGMFSYGRGSCGEFWSGFVPAGVASVAEAGIAEMLARRSFLDVATYERLHRAGDEGGVPPAGFAGEFVYQGTCDRRRRYAAVEKPAT